MLICHQWNRQQALQVCLNLASKMSPITHQWRQERQQTSTATDPNSNKPAQQQIRTATNQHSNRPEQHQTNTETYQNSNKPAQQHIRTATNQHSHRSEQQQTRAMRLLNLFETNHMTAINQKSIKPEQ